MSGDNMPEFYFFELCFDIPNKLKLIPFICLLIYTPGIF